MGGGGGGGENTLTFANLRRGIEIAAHATGHGFAGRCVHYRTEGSGIASWASLYAILYPTKADIFLT